MKRLPAVIYGFIVRKYYLDDIALAIANFFQKALAGVLFRFDWSVLIQTGVNGAARVTARTGDVFRRMQTGRAQHYLMYFSAAAILLAVVFVWKG